MIVTPEVTLEQKARVAKYTTENGTTNAIRRFLKDIPNFLFERKYIKGLHGKLFTCVNWPADVWQMKEMWHLKDFQQDPKVGHF